MDVLTEKAFEYFGALAFILAFLMFGFAWVTRQWMAERAKVDALNAERLKDAKELTSDQAEIGEAMRTTMAANTAALAANTRVMETMMERHRGQL